MHDSASFWTDIKNLEEQLVKTPQSYCFARLSEIYLKVGLIDDALHVARQGIIKHPRYISGQRAFSQACYSRGLNAEAIVALRMITEALPEDVASQKLFGRLLLESGEQEAACQAFRTALEFAPDDVECRIELESIGRSSLAADTVDEADEEIIDGLEILDELEIIDDEQEQFEQVQGSSDIVAEHDPLSTGTLAELYVKQGFIHKALDIYRAILSDDPGNAAIASRVIELEKLDSVQAFVADSGIAGDIENYDDQSLEPLLGVAAVFEPVSASDYDCIAETVVSAAFDVVPDANAHAVDIGELPQHGIADNAISVLEVWLENIRRFKSCR